MVGKAPQTKNWEAWEDRQPNVGGGGPTLHVTGEVEASNTPQLRKHQPPGLNPKIEMLDLSADTSGAVRWQTVHFQEPVQKGQYSSVDILWEGSKIANIDNIRIVQ